MASLRQLDEMAGLFRDGMTIGIGGWGSRRKPMALVRELVRSGARDLTVVTFGGPDAGILCASGQASRIVHGFVSLDSIPIDPHFAAARQRGAVATTELDEAMLVAGLRAASRRLPFEVLRNGIGSDAVTENPEIRTIVSPYGDGETLVAMPAIPLDIALVHVEQADRVGNAQCLGPDPFFDELIARAAALAVVSAERIVGTERLAAEHPSTLILNRSETHVVTHAPRGAGFTALLPEYARDEVAQRAYADSARDAEASRRYLDEYLAHDATRAEAEGEAP
ncbi:CoA transferase subunit A [Microbacterium sp. zg.Y909]|uniref:CoA transferase subunit A n=1 Tax=Microbacterium sp. zg.Y909 TaxID=2969413 RepID=UPI00214C7AEE|nr:CoA-transferase [Microbacterium sp. zg.Y909]MCR2824174.1 acyl CoA--acetate/3-ketoacid CoA transferase subunit alpha [Microbacterium sp. zg.Y909]